MAVAPLRLNWLEPKLLFPSHHHHWLPCPPASRPNRLPLAGTGRSPEHHHRPTSLSSSCLLPSPPPLSSPACPFPQDGCGRPSRSRRWPSPGLRRPELAKPPPAPRPPLVSSVPDRGQGEEEEDEGQAGPAPLP
ncbi:hypothetical protein ACQJBY_033053 [Aegilops geniculata]